MQSTSKNRASLFFILMAIAIPLLFVACLVYGSVSIPLGALWDIFTGKPVENTAWSNIIFYSRIPQAITALFAGAGLAISGLLLQTFFQNPLAGPSILGLSSGANLGVGVVMLLTGGTIGNYATFNFGAHLAIVLAAFLGAGLVLAIILFFSSRLKSNLMLLIVGIMVGYLASSVIDILNFYASSDSVHTFIIWGMGNFSGVTVSDLPFFCVTVFIGLLISFLLVKPLNALLLGERYALNLGVKIQRTRTIILICTGLLTAVITAFCGPVSFIGLAVPHLARLLLGSANHRQLVPMTLLMGSLIALLCNFITTLPAKGGILPLNAITPLVGVPVILYVIMSNRKLQSFN